MRDAPQIRLIIEVQGKQMGYTEILFILAVIQLDKTIYGFGSLFLAHQCLQCWNGMKLHSYFIPTSYPKAICQELTFDKISD